MRRILTVGAVLGVAGLLVAQAPQPTTVSATLNGYQEAPIIVTNAKGTFKATINASETLISYDLDYSGLTNAVTQAHIHIGQRNVSGGITLWLCGTATNPGPASTPPPPCPGLTGKVSGTLSAAELVGPAGQGIGPAEMAKVIRAIKLGYTYANVHSTLAPGGEIRGQIKLDGPDSE